MLFLKDICLDLRKGEILGIAGVDGNGQNELAEVIAGLRKIKIWRDQYGRKIYCKPFSKAN